MEDIDDGSVEPEDPREWSEELVSHWDLPLSLHSTRVDPLDPLSSSVSSILFPLLPTFVFPPSDRSQ